MPDSLLESAIEDATHSEKAAELHRQSRRFEDLRDSPAWAELREVVKSHKARLVDVLGKKALAGADAQELRDEGIFSRGALRGMELLLDMPDDVHKRLEALINDSYQRLAREAAEASASPYT